MLRGSVSLPIAVVVLMGCREVHAETTIYVDADNGGAQDGSAKAPHRSLQAAIDVAANGDVIKVAQGTYAPIAVKSKAVSMYGGFVGGTAATYAKGSAGDFDSADRDANVTRIKGTGKGIVVNLDIAGATRIEGFFISGGEQGIRSDGYPFNEQEPQIVGNVIEDNRADISSEGGAMWCKTNLVVSNNIIRNNRAGRGAGIACFNEKLVIVDNVIENNVGIGDHGGGIYAGSANLQIARNRIENNEAGHGDKNGVGGAMCILGAGTRATISENVITANKATERGAGVFIDDEAHATISNNLIFANGCGFRGGAAITVDGLDDKKLSKATIVQNTIANHVCEGPGNSLQVQNADVTVSSSIMWNNGDDFYTFDNASLTVSNSIVKESVEGENNRNVDPLFADAKNGDFHLRSKFGRYQAGKWVTDDAQSPAIDAADPGLDASKEPAPNGNRANLGAYGGTSQASKSEAGPAGPSSSAAPGPGLLGSAQPPPLPAPVGTPTGCGGCSHVPARGPWPAGLILIALGLARRVGRRQAPD